MSTAIPHRHHFYEMKVGDGHVISIHLSERVCYEQDYSVTIEDVCRCRACVKMQLEWHSRDNKYAVPQYQPDGLPDHTVRFLPYSVGSP